MKYDWCHDILLALIGVLVWQKHCYAIADIIDITQPIDRTVPVVNTKSKIKSIHQILMLSWNSYGMAYIMQLNLRIMWYGQIPDEVFNHAADKYD